MRPKKKISQNDIARALGVSNVSVSNALAGRKGVSEDLIQRVRRTAAEMGYETGKSNADSGRNLVILVTPDGQPGENEDSLTEILRGLQFQVKHYTISEVSGRKEARRYDLENCLGILVPEPLPTGKLLSLREKSDRPVIGIGFFDSHVPMDFVADDGFHGAQSMVRYLRKRGYERILYVRPDPDASAMDGQKAMLEDRLLGYRSELYLETLHRGLTMEQAQPFDVEENQDILTVSDVEQYLQQRQASERKQAGEKQSRTVFFCGDMKTAQDLLDCLEERQIPVPDEIGLAGYLVGKESCLQAGECRITAYVNSERRLLEQCCTLLRDWRRGEVGSGTVHQAAGAIAEGCTA